MHTLMITNKITSLFACLFKLLGLASGIRPKKKVQGMRNRKDETKQILYVDDVIIYKIWNNLKINY